MARPETHTDLPEYELKPRSIIIVSDHDVLAAIPGAMAAFWQLVDLLRAADDTIVVDGHDVQRVLTADELDAKVRTAQRSWDQGFKDYTALQETGKRPQFPYAMQSYCRAEGIDVPGVAS